MNDPDSYENVETSVDILEGGTFQVINKFRAKNAFGALVLNSVTAELDKDGNVLKILSQE